MHASAVGTAEHPRDIDERRRARDRARERAWDLDEVIGTVGLSISARLWLARSARLGSEELATRLVDEALLIPPAGARHRPRRGEAR